MTKTYQLQRSVSRHWSPNAWKVRLEGIGRKCQWFAPLLSPAMRLFALCVPTLPASSKLKQQQEEPASAYCQRQRRRADNRRQDSTHLSRRFLLLGNALANNSCLIGAD